MGPVGRRFESSRPDHLDEFDNAAVATIRVAGPDFAIVAIQTPLVPPLVGGAGNGSYDVAIENLERGSASGHITVGVSGNMGQTYTGTVPFSLGLYER